MAEVPAGAYGGGAGGIPAYDVGTAYTGGLSPRREAAVRQGYRGVPRAAPMRPAAAQRRTGASGRPPPGTFNPEREWARETNEGRERSKEGEAETARERLEHDYYTREGQIRQREGYRRTDAARALAAVKRSYGILATRQEESANKAGVLQGGALIQAAAKRATNEGLAEEPINTNLQRGLTGDREARELLAQQQAPPAQGGLDWAHLIGSGAGRRIEDLAHQILNQRKEGVQFGVQTEEGENDEARKGGWEPQEPSKAPAAAKAAPARYLNRATGRMETARAIRGYRRR